jgi:GAF domain-containing protein
MKPTTPTTPMTPTRFTVVPEEKFSGLRSSVQERLKVAATFACGETFRGLLDSGIVGLLDCAFQNVGAHEGTIWLLNTGKDALVPRFNTGARAREFVGRYHQPLTSGLVSVVFHTEQPLSENGVYRSTRHDKTLDLQLGLHTCAMIAVPFNFCGEVRGVLSCVQVKPAAGDEPDPPGFTEDHQRVVQMVASAVGRLIEGKMLRLCIGLEEEG